MSPSRLAFFDSSDVFVLLSGASMALAYGGRPLAMLIPTLWRRACQLYGFNLAIVLITVAMLTAILAWRGSVGVHATETALIDAHGVHVLLWHALTLRQTVGYSPVLRLYLALTVVAPLLLIMGQWRWWSPLVPAVLLWIAAGHFDLVMRNSLSGEPFVITILPWIFLFSIGIVMGRASILGIDLPRSRSVLVLAFANLAGYLILSVIAVRIWPPAHDWAMSRNEFFWLGASKTYQSPLRLLHLLSLAYIVLTLPRAPVIRLLHEIRPNQVVCRLGRHSLLVYSFGAVASIAVSEVLDLVRNATDAALLPRLGLELVLVALYVRVALGLVRMRPTLGRSARGARVHPTHP